MTAARLAETSLPSRRIAVSPCPNDTFIFAAWMLGLVESPDARPARFYWADVQELNLAAARSEYEVIKVSAVQGLKLRSRYHILDCGGAFGLQAGPAVVSRPGTNRLRLIAVPGLETTAYALLCLAWAGEFEARPLRYDRIPEAVQRGEVDAGLLIHESALVYAHYGLDCVLDLGAWWRRHSGGLPLPLGVILVHRNQGPSGLEAVAQVVRRSLDLAQRRPGRIWPLVRGLAQEADDRTLQAHVQAYVNELSQDHSSSNGRQGLILLEQLLGQAQSAGSQSQINLTAASEPVCKP